MVLVGLSFRVLRSRFFLVLSILSNPSALRLLNTKELEDLEPLLASCFSIEAEEEEEEKRVEREKDRLEKGLSEREKGEDFTGEAERRRRRRRFLGK